VNIKEFCETIEEIVPLELKESFDNVGLQVECENKEIKKILVALDCTLDVIEEAKNNNIDMIFTHHPLLFLKPSSITYDTLQGKKILELIKNDIALYSSHTNLDSVKNGLNDRIVKELGFPESQIMESKISKHGEYGIGRFVNLDSNLELGEILRLIKQNLNVNTMRYSGDLSKKIKSIAIINGAGQDFFLKAKEMGADCIITGDTTYHYVSDFNELSIAIIDIGHFGSEWPVLKAVFKDIEKEFLKDKNIEVLYSKASKDPYEFFME
jgi:dinuclear metal center YbgI/SA1388 family protein